MLEANGQDGDSICAISKMFVAAIVTFKNFLMILEYYGRNPGAEKYFFHLP